MNRLFKGFFFSRYAAAAEWCYVNKVLTCLFFRYSGILYLGNLHIGKAIRGCISYHTFNYFNTCTDNPGKVNWWGAKGLSPSSSLPEVTSQGEGLKERGEGKKVKSLLLHISGNILKKLSCLGNCYFFKQLTACRGNSNGNPAHALLCMALM